MNNGLVHALLVALKQARSGKGSVGVYQVSTAWRLGESRSELAHYRVHPSGRVFLCQDNFEMTVVMITGAHVTPIPVPPEIRALIGKLPAA